MYTDQNGDTLQTNSGCSVDGQKINDIIKRCDGYLNRYIFRAKGFINYACFQYGLYNYAMSEEVSAQFVDDFQYFIFTKSTKSLLSI